MGALLALIASISWGVADFAGGLASRKVGTIRTISVSYPAGAVLLTLLALTIVPGTIDGTVLVWSAGVGIVGLAAMSFLYRALAEGPMGIVSPITALGSAVIPVVVGLARGETLTALAIGGMALAVVAVVLVSREPGPHRSVSPRALALSGAAGLTIGVYLTGLGLAPDYSGIWVTTLGRWLACIIVVTVAIVMSRRATASSWAGYPWGLAIMAGVLDASANGFFQFAARLDELAIVAVIGCLYPAATVLLARWFLAERMSRVQVVGVALALGAVVALTIP